MDIESRKYHLIEKVMNLDEGQTKKLEAFLSEVAESELSTSLDRAISQVKSGKVTPHDEVKKKYEKWL
jgi:hypothetical protein